MRLTIDCSEFHPKAWGSELWIAANDEYCGKILEFKPGSKFSGHLHCLKKESWYCVEGKFRLTGIDTTNAEKYELILNPGDIVHIPRMTPHQLECISKVNGVIFEVSTPHFETDSYRYEPGDSQK